MKIDHILVPFNGTPHAIRALESALDIADRYTADILVVYVIPIGTLSLRTHQAVIGEGSLTTPTIPTPKTTVTGVSRGADIIRTAKTICQNSDVKVRYEIRQGARTSELIKLAQQNYDLIVLGVRPTMKVRKLFFGNVATSLINEAPCSVLIIRGMDDKKESVD
jgi:nucleotide-binding universal stress UspA family protein